MAKKSVATCSTKKSKNHIRSVSYTHLDVYKRQFIHTFGDAHIYNNHFEQVTLQLSREPKPLPQMVLNPNVKNILDFTFEDFTLHNYDPHPHIKGEVAI